MFNQIEINSFRGISHAFVKDFGQINLFFGKNNCGKSSLLEAIFLISGISNPSLAFNINFVREYDKTRLGDLSFVFHDLKTNRPIVIQTKGREERKLDISFFESEESTIKLDSKTPNMLSNIKKSNYGLKFSAKVDNRSFNSQITLDDNNPRNLINKLPGDYTEPIKSIYLPPKYAFATSIEGLNKIIQNKDEQFIVDGLKLLEHRVSDFVFADGEILVDVGLCRRIPVNMLGDGARKIVSLLTAVYHCKNGVLLIDEISNGFHHSVMCSLWKILIDAATKNNTQIFATTHDADSIKGLRDAALGSEHQDKIASFKLLKTQDDHLEALHYSLESIDYSFNQAIEIR